MLKKFLLLTSFILILVLACVTEEETVDTLNKLDKIDITSFKIVNNTEFGISTKTELRIESTQSIVVSDHGVILQKNGSFYDKISLGALKEKTFELQVNSGLAKGESYTIFPFIFAKNTFFYGDTLTFVSKVENNFSINKISPLNGFINDTILITGKNFCTSSETNKNLFHLGEAIQKVIFESDSLIKVVVLPNVSTSKLPIKVTTCGKVNEDKKFFVLDSPVLDSISPSERYVGESVLFYGKNILSYISKVWIGDFELAIDDIQEINKLQVKVTKDFPSGLLDVKIQVLDQIIEKKAFYQSTTPVIRELNKRKTGFLDTLIVKGDYFKQRNEPLEVFIGNTKQQILSSSKTEIKIIIDSYFEEENPKLVLKTGSFELSEDITMLPPEIISFDKEKYHLYDEEIKIKTKYFLGYNDNVKIGEVHTSDRSYKFEPVASDGILTLLLTPWLEAVYNRYPKFVFDKVGELKLSLTTAYGSTEKNFKVFKPFIEGLSDNTYFHNSSISINGLDFGYDKVTQVFIDNVEIVNPYNSSYTVSNKNIVFRIPSTLKPGTHTVKVVTGGQISNEVQFELSSISATNISSNSGTRKDIFTIFGTNLDKLSSYGFMANGFACTKLNASSNRVDIILPYNNPLQQETEILLLYGDQITKVGTVNGIEPYENFENYEHPNNLGKFSSSFEYNGKLYGIGYNGIYEFNTSSERWTTYETNMINISNYIFNDHNISVVGDNIYLAYSNNFLIYNMQTKLWSVKELNIQNGLFMHRGVISGDYAYLLMKRAENTSNMMLYKYDLTNNEYSLTNQPNLKNLLGAVAVTKLFEKNGKLYLDVLDDQIMVYDVNSGLWENIGFPVGKGTFHYDNNLYVYNNVLYFSGGRWGQYPEQFMYAYNLNTKRWSEKTPMLLKLMDHTLYGEGNYLYISMGAGEFGYDNKEMIRYTITTDPH